MSEGEWYRNNSDIYDWLAACVPYLRKFCVLTFSELTWELNVDWVRLEILVAISSNFYRTTKKSEMTIIHPHNKQS